VVLMRSRGRGDGGSVEAARSAEATGAALLPPMPLLLGPACDAPATALLPDGCETKREADGGDAALADEAAAPDDEALLIDVS
jgi:hypothetical protein